jgi:hypothetical protein
MIFENKRDSFALRAALAFAAASGLCLAAADCGSGGGDPLA